MNEKFCSFVIENTYEWVLTILHEPEGFEYKLLPSERIVIEMQSVDQAVIVRPWLENGEYGISILPEGSNFRVFHNGVNVFEKLL